MSAEIVLYGNDVLRQVATPVEAVDDDIRALVKDLLESMHVANGLGLAAEQIGRTEAICVVHIPLNYTRAEGEPSDEPSPGIGEPLVLINPEITAREGEQFGQEGCLSFPEIYVSVKRSMDVTVEYLGDDGSRQSTQATGLLSRAIQHELDHLTGVLLVDHMSPVQKISVAGRLRRLRKSAKG